MTNYQLPPAKYTLQQFNLDFPDNEACLWFLFRQVKRICPKCGSSKYYHQRGTAHFICSCTSHQVSPKAGTIFAKSSTDLVKWFYAIYLFSKAKNAVSASEVQRHIGVSYKCAWRIMKQIRTLQAPYLYSSKK